MLRNQKRARPTFEAFKQQYPERYSQIITTAIKLQQQVVPQLETKVPPLDWWEPRLGFLLAPAYERRQVLRGVLDEIGIEWGSAKREPLVKDWPVQSTTTGNRKTRKKTGSQKQRTLDSLFHRWD